MSKPFSLNSLARCNLAHHRLRSALAGLAIILEVGTALASAAWAWRGPRRWSEGH